MLTTTTANTTTITTVNPTALAGDSRSPIIFIGSSSLFLWGKVTGVTLYEARDGG